MKTAKEYVKDFIDGHESDTFVRNQYGKMIYSACHSSLNLEIFFEDLVEEVLESLPKKTNEAETIKQIELMCIESLSPVELEKWESVKNWLIKNRGINVEEVL